MDIDGKRRSDNFEDRGSSGGGGRRGGGRGMAGSLMGMAVRRFGIKGGIAAGVVIGGVYFFGGDTARQALLGGSVGTTVATGAKVCDSSNKSAAACDFSRAVLASTEDVWNQKFSAGALPTYKKALSRSYQEPSLVVFAGAVSTGGCGNASSAVGPFYCPADKKLYIDPSFYDEMESKLKAPGDFAQAYVLAHEVGHHVQNLIGSSSLSLRGETKNQASVRVELQADCFAGVWGNVARKDLSITKEDLGEALQAAHSIGDDALGHSDKSKFTHGSSKQRMKWFNRGFESGDPGKCDTFAVRDYKAL